MRLFLILTLTATSLFAAQVGLEIKGGISASTLYGEDLSTTLFENKRPRVSFAGGIALPLAITPVFTIQPELLFTRQGAILNAPIDKELHRNYLSLPLLFRFELNRTSEVAPYLYVGPTTSFLLSADERSLDTTTADTNPKDYITPVDVALTIGGGIAFEAGIGKVLMDMRYIRGYISTIDTQEWNAHHLPEKQIDDDITIKNITMLFMVGYAFEF